MIGDGMKKRLFAVALAALIPATGMLIYNEVWYRAQRNAEIHNEALQGSRQVASEVDRILDGARSLLIATAVVPSVTGDETTRCSSVLSEITKSVKSISSMSMIGPDGIVLCSSLPMRNGINLADRPYFKRALETEDFVVGGFTKGRISNSNVLPVAKSVIRGGKLRGVLVAGLRLEWLQARIQERGTLADWFISIADQDGIIVVRTPPLPTVIGTKISPEFMHLLHQPTPGTLEATSRDGISRIIGYHPVTTDRPFYIATGFSKNAAFEPVNRGSLMAGLLILLSGFLAAAAAIFVGDRFIIKPINNVVSVIERWAAGDIAVRTSMRGNYGEIGQVATAVDELLDELERRRAQAEEAESARVFLSRELSHRVKNTLSVVQAIARQTFAKLVPPQAIETYSIRVRALAGAYDTLLAEEHESADIKDVIERAVTPHHEPGDNRFHLDGPMIALPSKAVVALSLVLHELATNAVKYGALSTLTGHVELTWHQADGRVHLGWIEKGGPPVSKPEREGFGTKVVSRAFAAEFEAKETFDYLPDGLHFGLVFKALPSSDDAAT
jgi:two-component sensor histidine kinase